MTMIQNTRIILADKRKQELLDNHFSSRHSIAYHQEEEHPTRHFGSLHLFSETTLGALKKNQFVFEESMQILLIPIIGCLRATTANNEFIVDVGEALILATKSHEALLISNDFENSEIHYVIASFSSNEQVQHHIQFSLAADRFSVLIDHISTHGIVKAHISQWNGRSEGELKPTTNHTYAWVMQGSFELANCLLQKGDGLAINGYETIEFEALANDAIILFLEMT